MKKHDKSKPKLHADDTGNHTVTNNNNDAMKDEEEKDENDDHKMMMHVFQQPKSTDKANMYDVHDIFSAAIERKKILEQCGITRECCVRQTLFSVDHSSFQLHCNKWIQEGKRLTQMLPKCENRVINTQNVMQLFMEFATETEKTNTPGINPTPSPTTPSAATTPFSTTPSIETMNQTPTGTFSFSFASLQQK